MPQEMIVLLTLAVMMTITLILPKDKKLTMNAKHYVSLEAAKMLKEEGYDWDAIYAYNEINMQIERIGANANGISDYCSAPSLLEAMDWLEERGIIIEIKYAYDEEGNETFWLFDIYINHEMVSGDMDVFSKDRNECMKAAIKKGLELL